MRTVLVAVVLLASLAGAAQEPPPAAAFPSDRARFFPKASLDAWNDTLRLLRDLDLRPEETNNQGQFLVTRWVDIEKRRFGFDAEAMPDRPRSGRVQFHVLVSPYLQPARVFVGSIAELHGMRTAGGEFQGVSRRFYNVPIVGDWLLDKIGERLQVAGVPMPRELQDRQAAARALWPTGADDPCLNTPPPPARGSGRGPGVPGSGPGARGRGPVSYPTAIRRENPYFPADQMRPGTNVSVLVEVQVTEDGFAWPLRFIERAALDRQFDDSTMGAVSLWRMRPMLADECPAPMVTQISTSFSVR